MTDSDAWVVPFRELDLSALDRVGVPTTAT